MEQAKLVVDFETEEAYSKACYRLRSYGYDYSDESKDLRLIIYSALEGKEILDKFFWKDEYTVAEGI
jgi:hypothetical protein